jgi:hypothetical protein
VIVLVEWNDAYSESTSWITTEDIDQEPMRTVSVGFLLEDAKPHHVVIAQSSNAAECFDSVLCIPVAMVTRLAVISESALRPPSPQSVG